MTKHSSKSIEKLFSYSLIYARIFGICNFKYDFEKDVLLYPRGLKIYTIIANIVLIGFLPYSLYAQFMTDRDKYRDNILIAAINAVETLTYVIGVCSSLFIQWAAPCKYHILYANFATIRNKEGSTLEEDSAATRKVVILYILKFVCSIAFVIQCFVEMLFEYGNYSIQGIFIFLHFSALANIILTVENQFYSGIVYGGYLFELLNKRIRLAVHEVLTLDGKNSRISRQRIRYLNHEISVIKKIHTIVYELCNNVRDLYQVQFLMVLLTVLVTQVAIWFSIILYLGKNILQMEMTFFYVEVSRVMISAANFWLNFNVCGSVVYQCNLAGDHVKEMSLMPKVNHSLENNIETLAFQLKREKMRLNICGLFDVGWSTGFEMFKSCTFYLVVLIQLDYQKV